MDDHHLIVAVEESSSTVGFYDSTTGAEVGRVAVGFWPHEVAIDPDAGLAYVTNFGVKDYDETIGRPGSSISILDLANRCEVGRLYTDVEGVAYQAPHGVKLRPGRRQLYVNVEAGPHPALVVFDLGASPSAATFSDRSLSGPTAPVAGAVAGAAGPPARVFRLPGDLLVGPQRPAEAETAVLLALDAAAVAGPGPAVVEMVPATEVREHAAELTSERGLARFGASEGADSGAGAAAAAAGPPEQSGLPRGAHNLLFSPDGSHLWVFPALFTPPFSPQPVWGIVRLDPDTGEETARVVTPTAVRGLVYTTDGSSLVAAGAGEIYLLDAAHPETPPRTIGDLGVGQLLYPAVTPDGRYVLAPAVWQSQLLVIELATGRVAARLLTGIDPIQAVMSPDPDRAYVTHGRSLYLSEIDLKALAVSRRLPTRGGPNGLGVAPFTPVPKRKVLRLGATLPLSGANFNEGREIRLGYEFWKEQVNASGGMRIGGEPHLIETVYRDNGSPPPPEARGRGGTGAGTGAKRGGEVPPRHVSLAPARTRR